jgi:predicted permease
VTARGWLVRVRGLFTGAADEARLNEEAVAHMDQLAAEYERRGLAPEEARAAARREFGNLTAIRENHREQRRLPVLDTLAWDLRFALRQMRAKPGFAAAGVLTLALSIGANTAIFRVLDAVAIRLLPVKDPGQLVVIAAEQNSPGGGITFPNISYPLFREVASRQRVLKGIFATLDVEPDETTTEPRVDARLVTGTYFQVLGASAAIGRTILPEDDKPGAAPVAMLSYGYWQRAFGGDASALGRAVRVNGAALAIVGICPHGFFGERVGSAPDVWIPMQTAPLVWPERSAFKDWLNQRGSASLTPMGRLRPDVPMSRAQAELSALYSELHDLSPHSSRATSYAVKLRTGSQGFGSVQAQYGAPLRLLMAIAGLVLLLACCNLANLLLAHASARMHEMGVRMALGAGRARLLRQLLTESALLAGAGAALGFAVAGWGSKALVEIASAGDNWQLDLSPDGRLLAFTAAISTAAVFLFGLAPAVLATRVDAQASLQASQRASGSRGATALSRAFVTAQIAISLTLVTGAALLAHSFRNLETQDFGYRREGLLLVRFKMDHALMSLSNAARILPLRDRLAAIPGVRTAALAGPGPLARLQSSMRISIAEEPGHVIESMQAQISPGYFETMKIPILAGRAVSDEDRTSTAPAVVLSETAARRLFGPANPVGRVVVNEAGKRMQVVGIAHDVRANHPREAFQPIVYVPMTQRERSMLLTAAIRTAADPASLAPAVRAAVREQLPGIAIESAMPATGLLDGMMQQDRMLAALSGTFGLLALLLASVGLYGVIAYSVQRRTQELGIRVALGAERSQVTWMLLGETGRLFCIGLAMGFCGVLALAGWLRALLFAITPRDPLTLAAAAVLLSTVGLAAAYLPARRAARLDPMTALRVE